LGVSSLVMAVTSTETKSYYIDASGRRARELRRKVVFALTLVFLCVMLGVVIALVVSFGLSVAMQFLWNSVRG
jgi:hypothetical protein